MSLPRNLGPETVDLTQALALLSLPRTLGLHPETGEPITAGLGRFGPYLRSGDTYASLRGDDDVLTIGLNRAVDLLSRSRPAKAKGKDLGAHPEDGKPVILRAGRYGPYVEHGSTRVTLPDGAGAETLELNQALALLAAKEARGSSKKPVKSAKSAKKEKASGATPASKLGKKAQSAAETQAKVEPKSKSASKPSPSRGRGRGTG
jgi:DNA topoisomerase-1